jgi:hypothetical protein
MIERRCSETRSCTGYPAEEQRLFRVYFGRIGNRVTRQPNKQGQAEKEERTIQFRPSVPAKNKKAD